MTAERRNSRGDHTLVAIGRLKAGSHRGAGRRGTGPYRRAARAGISRTPIRTGDSAARPAMRFLVDGETRQYLQMLLWSVIFVLLIACANVANLQFARATGRLREVAVRTALGASRWRVVAQLVTESVLLSVTGAGLGLLLAQLGREGDARRHAGGDRPVHPGLETDGDRRPGAAVHAGRRPWPAAFSRDSRRPGSARGPNLSEALKEGGRGGTVGRSRHRLRNILVAAEIATGSGAAGGGRADGPRLSQPAHSRGLRSNLSTLLTMRLAITATKYPEKHQKAAFYRQLLERIQALPGVRAAAIVSAMPYSDHSSGQAFTIDGRAVEPGRSPEWHVPGGQSQLFFDLARAAALRASAAGRRRRNAPLVAVVSERMATRWWGQGIACRQAHQIGRAEFAEPVDDDRGVVGDMVHSPYDRQPRRAFYVPFDQAPQSWMDVGIRTAGDPLRVGPAVMAAVRSVDPEQPITDMQTMDNRFTIARSG